MRREHLLIKHLWDGLLVLVRRNVERRLQPKYCA